MGICEPWCCYIYLQNWVILFGHMLVNTWSIWVICYNYIQLGLWGVRAMFFRFVTRTASTPQFSELLFNGFSTTMDTLILGQSYMDTLILTSLLVSMGLSTNQQRTYFFAGCLRLATESPKFDANKFSRNARKTCRRRHRHPPPWLRRRPDSAMVLAIGAPQVGCVQCVDRTYDGIKNIPSGKRLQKTMENHHAIHGKIHYFYGHVQ